jgi:hypothetical protein
MSLTIRNGRELNAHIRSTYGGGIARGCLLDDRAIAGLCKRNRGGNNMKVQFYFNGSCIASEKLEVAPAIGWGIQVNDKTYVVKAVALIISNDPILRVYLKEGV